MVILTGMTGLTVIFTVFDDAGPSLQVSLEVITTEMASPFNGV
jgi:hypothetical protein